MSPLESIFPFGLESPTQFYLILFVLTWVLHVAFMGYVLAGSLYVAWATVFPGKSQRPRSEQPVCELLREWIPFMLSGAITAGVAPLLFVQVIYRQEFYTANLLLGWRWLMVIPVLIVAFYLLYLLKSRAVATWSLAARAITVSAVAGSFLFVAFCWTTNHLLGINRSGWADSYETGTVVAALFPLILRLLTWVSGVFPVMCLIVAWQIHGNVASGVSADLPTDSPDDSKSNHSLGGLAITSLIAATLLAIAYSFLLPKDVRGYVWGSAGQIWVAATVVGLGLQLAGWFLWNGRGIHSRRILVLISGGLLLTLAGTGCLREIVRLSQADILTVSSNCDAAAQVGGLWLFLISSVINIVLIVVCLTITQSRQSA